MGPHAVQAISAGLMQNDRLVEQADVSRVTELVSVTGNTPAVVVIHRLEWRCSEYIRRIAAQALTCQASYAGKSASRSDTAEFQQSHLKWREPSTSISVLHWQVWSKLVPVTAGTIAL